MKEEGVRVGDGVKVEDGVRGVKEEKEEAWETEEGKVVEVGWEELCTG